MIDTDAHNGILSTACQRNRICVCVCKEVSNIFIFSDT